MNSGKWKSIVAFVLGILFLSSQLAFAAEPSISVLGDVVGSGRSEMKAAFNNWISVSGKTFPVIDGASLRSGDGMMSLIFRDAVRMEVGKNTEVMVSGSRGDYVINVTTGQIAFSVPKGISFSVKTPTSSIQTKASNDLIQKVTFSSQDDVKGIVTYDGKGTRVTALNGNLMVRSGLGVQLQTVAAGNAIYVEGKDSGNVRTVQVPPQQSSEARFSQAAPIVDRPDTITHLTIGALGVGTVVGSYFLVNSLLHFSPPR